MLVCTSYNVSGPARCISTMPALTSTALRMLDMADDTLPATRAAAKAAGADYYFTGEPCGRGHVDRRRATDTKCLACRREDASKRYHANPEPNLRQAREWAARNPGARTANSKAWRDRQLADPVKAEAYRLYQAEMRAKHADKRAAYNAKWFRENAEQASARFKEYWRANKARYKAHSRKRQVAQMQRTPAWLTRDDLEAMIALYEEATRLSAETGIPHEVDHEIPLQGRTVSGLHVPSNLRILTRFQNRSKGNKHG